MRIEIKVMQSLNEKFMSDEETDPEDGTIKFSKDHLHGSVKSSIL